MVIVSSLVRLCAKEVVSDHSSSARWLGCVPRELYQPLLRLPSLTVVRWPSASWYSAGQRGLSGWEAGGGRGITRPAGSVYRLCCWLWSEDWGTKGALSRCWTCAGCSVRTGVWGTPWGAGRSPCPSAPPCCRPRAGPRRERERERKRGLETEAERDAAAKRERGLPGTDFGRASAEGAGTGRRGSGGRWRRGGARPRGPHRGRALRLHCRHLRVEEIPAANIAALLALLPRRGLLGLDVRYSSLGVAGLALLLPALEPFPDLRSLRLHYCNLDMRRDLPGQEGALREMAQGLGGLAQLRRLSLTALRLPGHLRMLLSSLSRPLEVLELPYLSLSAADLSYLSCSPHASSLRCLDLTAAASPTACWGAAALPGALPGPAQPEAGPEPAVPGRGAGAGPGGRRHPLPAPPAVPEPPGGVPAGPAAPPSSAQLLDWPLVEEMEVREAVQLELEKALAESGRCDLLLTSDLLSYSTDLMDED
ncbi:hypothetical protein ANANG_G00075930 [Anguilla anguilla]|uniref:Leucine-rich repeat-containing protein 14 n=1 Tax=Anguilla anguilla TaxID=7936 RepID=A0A9D3S2C7_ANGAN|nr:hypothetical protein ANANG_G00075930 [Anguilla anguilla]